MSRIAVIGGGAAGMMAAITAAGAGHRVTLLEHNEKLGKKLYITGKGRCNLTNACSQDELFDSVSRNPKFLYSAFHSFNNRDTAAFFEAEGIALKTERGNRVFPASDRASDVIRALERALYRNQVTILLRAEVLEILVREGTAVGVRWHASGHPECPQEFACDAVVIACGGLSYPATGSDGTGFGMLESLGHTVTDFRPSLVGMTVQGGVCARLAGLSLKNVTFTARSGKKLLFEQFGELLFTHHGISGPVVLTASSVIPDQYFKEPFLFEIDLKPALTPQKLDERILRDFKENANRQFKNSLGALLPSKLIPVIVDLSGIDPEKPVHDLTKEERRRLLALLKHFSGTVTGLESMQEAIITRGGIRVKEINPSTMESKLVRGLYVCGEMLDVDALTGGFNLQIAWSTGVLAGRSVP